MRFYIFLQTALGYWINRSTTCKLITKTTRNGSSGSADSLRFSFRNYDEEVSSYLMTSSGHWTHGGMGSSSVINFPPGTYPWNAVAVTQQGTDGINFEVFKLVCDNDKYHIDFVKNDNCPGSMWFDLKDHEPADDPCYEWATQTKYYPLKRGGGLSFFLCTRYHEKATKEQIRKNIDAAKEIATKKWGIYGLKDGRFSG